MQPSQPNHEVVYDFNLTILVGFILTVAALATVIVVNWATSNDYREIISTQGQTIENQRELIFSMSHECGVKIRLTSTYADVDDLAEARFLLGLKQWAPERQDPIEQYSSSGYLNKLVARDLLTAIVRRLRLLWD